MKIEMIEEITSRMNKNEEQEPSEYNNFWTL